MKPPRATQTIVETLSEEEIKRLLAVPDPKTAVGAWDLAILWTLLDTGLRCSELAGLTLEGADLEQGYLKVLGKGNKERIVPLGDGSRKYLFPYRDHFRPEPANPLVEQLFLSHEGFPMTVNAIEQRVKKIGRKAEIVRLHVHLLRHTFATNFLIYECGDVFRLQQILGHTTLEMVRRYVHLASAKTACQNRKFSPMDKINLKQLRIVLARSATGKRALKAVK